MRSPETANTLAPHRLLATGVRKFWRWGLGVVFVAIVLPLMWLFAGTVLLGLTAVGAAMHWASNKANRGAMNNTNEAGGVSRT